MHLHFTIDFWSKQMKNDIFIFLYKYVFFNKKISTYKPKYKYIWNFEGQMITNILFNLLRNLKLESLKIQLKEKKKISFKNDSQYFVFFFSTVFFLSWQIL